MADGISVQLLGADRFAATTDRAARDISTFDAASRSAAMSVANQARSRAPRLTGRLAASITGKPDGRGGFDVAVRLGLVYPVVQEYGSRYVRGRHYLRATIGSAVGVITRADEADLERIVGTIRGT